LLLRSGLIDICLFALAAKINADVEHQCFACLEIGAPTSFGIARVLVDRKIFELLPFLMTDRSPDQAFEFIPRRCRAVGGI
jgi:hypothetical protein